MSESMIAGQRFDEKREAVYVPHVLEYANKNIQGNPFEKGVPSAFIRFLARFARSYHPSLRAEVGVRKAHGRSSVVLFGKPVQCEDEFGAKYTEFDEKGTGDTERGAWTQLPDKKRIEGLAERKRAQRDTKHNTMFSQWGIRTHRTLAVAELLRFPDEVIGYVPKDILEKLSDVYTRGDAAAFRETLKVVAEKAPLLAERLRSEKFSRRGIPGSFETVIQVRAYRCADRLRDICEMNDANEVEERLAHVMGILKRDEGLDFKNDIGEYLTWFSKTMGRNYGIMHAKGFIHRFATRHNMTTAAEVVDLDSAHSTRHEEPEKEGAQDFHAEVNERARTASR